MAIFTSLREDPSPEPRKRIGARTESIAFIAKNGPHSCILDYDGQGLEAYIEASGATLDGLEDDAPEGVSIWEGTAKSWTNNTPEHGIDYEMYLDGSFRELTPGEWALLRETGVPWEYEPVGVSK